jgi:hypothetical protein
VQDNQVIPDQDFSGVITVPVAFKINPESSVDIPITILAVNDKPVIRNFSGSYAGEPGQTVSVEITDFDITDSDNTTQDFTLAVQAGSGYSVVNNGTAIHIDNNANPGSNLVVPVRVSDGKSLSDAMQVSVDVLLVTGIAGEQSTTVTVFPNPSNGKFLITVPAEARKFSYKITDNTGRILQQSIATASDSPIHIDLAHSGVYVLSIQTEYGMEIRKIIVNR